MAHLKKSFKINLFFLQQINHELLLRPAPVSRQSFSPVKEGVPRGHLSEAANTYATRLINNHRGSPQSEPDSNKSVAKMCFSIWGMNINQPLFDTNRAIMHF